MSKLSQENLIVTTYSGYILYSRHVLHEFICIQDTLHTHKAVVYINIKVYTCNSVQCVFYQIYRYY